MNTAILTIQSMNYGNRLQNYALQSVLKDLETDVDSLRRDAAFKGSFNCKLRALKHSVGIIKHLNDKQSAFRRFDKEYIRFSSCTVSTEYVSPELNDVYDVFIIGSDQVWNPDFTFNSELDYLPMVNRNKKIAYAASFGVNSIDDSRSRTAELLRDIPSISVREQAGASIVKDLIHRDVPVVLDPTMLLSVDEWAKIAKRPNMVKVEKPFVLKCVLGNDVNDGKIEQLADSNGLEIVNVMNSSLPIGPSEFVWLISRSSLVCTDSFHASVFALLHHKPLAIFERVSNNADMSSRFDTLCSKFSLAGIRSSEGNFGPDRIFGTDWGAFESALAAEREYSRAWLTEAIRNASRG